MVTPQDVSDRLHDSWEFFFYFRDFVYLKKSLKGFRILNPAFLVTKVNTTLFNLRIKYYKKTKNR